MCTLICLLLLLSQISSDDHSVEIAGNIGTMRTVLLSENTISNDDFDVTTSGSGEHLLGSIEINIFSNEESSGLVYMSNIEFQDGKFRSIQEVDEAIRVAVRTDTNPSTGATEDPTLLLSSTNNPVTIRDPSADTGGVGFDERIHLEFYSQDDVDNSLNDGVYFAHFDFYWSDDP